MGVINEDMSIQGLLTSKTMKIPDGTVNDAAVASNAGIQATKLQHQHRQIYAQGSATTASSATQVIHTVYGATGTVIAFKAGCVVPNAGAATITVDLKKNGSSILGAAITLNNSQSARQLVAATISNASLVTTDVLEIVVTATAGGGTLGQGLFVALTVNEDPA